MDEILANKLTHPILKQGDLQIWKILTKQSRTTEQFWSYIQGLSVGIIPPPPPPKKNVKIFKNIIMALEAYLHRNFCKQPRGH